MNADELIDTARQILHDVPDHEHVAAELNYLNRLARGVEWSVDWSDEESQAIEMVKVDGVWQRRVSRVTRRS